uniref:Metalloendopeptidase n=1 Tax=Cuerna arida TaxID=1464854 RepID=A0A1B6EY94_9HEMI
MGHAMGLLHEHQRPDRDCYIYISPSLLSAHRKSLRKIPGKRFPSGFPYDMDSIMHYTSSRVFHAHSDSKRSLGRDDATLSMLDIHKLNHLYCGRRNYCQEQNTCDGFYNFSLRQPLCFRQGPAYASDPRTLQSLTEDVSSYEEM